MATREHMTSMASTSGLPTEDVVAGCHYREQRNEKDHA